MTGRTPRWYTDGDGRRWLSPAGMELIAGMAEPVQCAHCGALYDLRAVTGAVNYADCSVWRTPCCNREVDDRKIVTHYQPVASEPAHVRDRRGVPSSAPRRPRDVEEA